MSDLEQRIKEAAENDKQSGGATLFHTDDILALLAEKDAEIERLTEELQAIDAVLARRPALADLDNRYSKVERACRIAGNAESAERERGEWKGVATDFYISHFHDETRPKCQNCKTYDALVKGE